MAHEIPRTRKPFFSTCARELNLGRICPYEFVDGSVRCLPETTLLHFFAGSENEWLFMGSFWDRLQIAVQNKRKQAWSPPHQHNKNVAALTIVVNNIIHLMSLTSLPSDISFCLHIYFDAHVPLMCAVEEATTDNLLPLFHKYRPNTTEVIQESNLPDVINEHLDCSFWNENKTKMKPIVHLMCKALPQRCQIRNLREIISNYCQTDDTVHEFMRTALLCSLLGAYKHCKKRLHWSARKEIIHRLVYSKPNRTQLQEWLFTNYQHLLFYTIKEFLTFSMPMIPALYNELCSTYKWSVFEETVCCAMDKARTMVESNIMKSSSIQDWMSHVETALILVNKQQLCNLYRPQRQTFAQTVITACDRIDENQYRVNIYEQFPIEYVHLMRKMMQRVQRNTIHIEWLTYFNVKQSAIQLLVNMYKHVRQNSYRTELRKMLQNLPRYDFEAIRALFAAFYQTHTEIRVFPLPSHLYDSQCNALRRRYGLQHNDELPAHVGIVYLCLSCHSFKGFVVNKDSKINNLFANGHSKIIIDDETLKCYCGKRCEKSDTKKRKRIDVDSFLESVELEEHRKRRVKKNWKSNKKMIQNERCTNTECVQINMTGCLLQYYGTLYLFCPSCGNPTTYHRDQYNKHGFTCGQCMKDGTLYTSVSCTICGTYRGKDTWTTVQTSDEKTVPICNGCYKPWLREYDGVIPHNILQQQRDKIKKKSK